MDCGNRLIQLTNYTVGAIPTATVMPLGIVTRKVARESTCKDTFDISSNANNVVYISEPGFYNISYTGNFVATAAGNVVINLQINGTTVQTSTVTATAGGNVQVAINFETRVFKNCNSITNNIPALVGLLNSGVALTSGTSNLVITRLS